MVELRGSTIIESLVSLIILSIVFYSFNRVGITVSISQNKESYEFKLSGWEWVSSFDHSFSLGAETLTIDGIKLSSKIEYYGCFQGQVFTLISKDEKHKLIIATLE